MVSPERSSWAVSGAPREVVGWALGLHLVRVTSPEHTHGRQQDKRLKDWIVGLMPVACKKPGSRLQRKMGGRVE